MSRSARQVTTTQFPDVHNKDSIAPSREKCGDSMLNEKSSSVGNSEHKCGDSMLNEIHSPLLLASISKCGKSMLNEYKEKTTNLVMYRGRTIIAGTFMIY